MLETSLFKNKTEGRLRFKLSGKDLYCIMLYILKMN